MKSKPGLVILFVLSVAFLFLRSSLAKYPNSEATQNGDIIDRAEQSSETDTPASSEATPSIQNTKNMKRLPGGTFWMGCVPGDDLCDESEKPRHQVTLSPFWLDIHEVTVADYAECVTAGVCKKPKTNDEQEADDLLNELRNDRKKHPVNGVDWDDADTYCRWRGKRLPTEAEFEFVLRDKREGNVYPWGNNLKPPAHYGNFADRTAVRHFTNGGQSGWLSNYNDGFVGSSPVCSFKRNRYGLCDISGNVREWVVDRFQSGFDDSSPNIDPRGPSSGSYRVVRGAGFALRFPFPGYLRASYRGMGERSEHRSFDIGFRCAGN